MRSSLRRRFAIWVAAAIVATIALYGVVVYLLVSAEIPKITSGDPDEAGERGGEEILEAMLLAAPIALAGGVAAAGLLSKRALAPIDDVVAAAGELTAHDLHTRLPEPARDDELRALVVALNALLARLGEGFDALGRQAAEASHELRTPLAVIATELEVALRRPRDAAAWEETATRTLAEVRRLSTLVDGLLELSRAGAPAAGGAPVDVVAVAEQVCGGLAAAAEARGVTLELDAPDPASVRGHGGAIEGALRNLVGNALRFTPRGGRVIVRVGSGADVRVSVEDSGPGVAPDERERVFEPFVRGAASAAAPGGLGLGLAIVRKVVQAHDGAVAVADSPLGGARFTITLPALAGAA
jgi:two-component system OmpR family sensor kinase